MLSIDLNSDLGESFGPWVMGHDEQVLQIVTSANVACGGHASDPDTMVKTLTLAKANNVVVGAHPGYPDLLGFGRRTIPCTMDEITHFVAGAGTSGTVRPKTSGAQACSGCRPGRRRRCPRIGR